jgi:hypothetical protein
MKTQDFITGINSVLVLVLLGMHLSLNLDVKALRKSYSPLAKKIQTDSLTIIKMKSQMDSLKMNEKAMVKSIIYLDSLNQEKASKADRAERRGRFVGGLLKGLLPHL